MELAIGMNRKVEAFKKLETYAYQVAYYILEDECLAIHATKCALLELSKEDDEFYRNPLLVQRDILKKLIIKKSIAVKKELLLYAHPCEARNRLSG